MAHKCVYIPKDVKESLDAYLMTLPRDVSDSAVVTESLKAYLKKKGFYPLKKKEVVPGPDVQEAKVPDQEPEVEGEVKTVPPPGITHAQLMQNLEVNFPPAPQE